MDKILYSVKQMPVFQNLAYENISQAINCNKGDTELVQNSINGLIYLPATGLQVFSKKSSS